VRHPNITNTLLVFFPFVSGASELTEQINRLFHFSSSLSGYKEVLLARIEEKIAGQVLADEAHADALQPFDEKKLDWVYPSYDICVESLLNPLGPRFSIYRNKIGKFRKQGIEIIPASQMPSPREFCRAITSINKSWIQTKVDSGTLLREDITESELKAPYRALIRASKTSTSDIDGIFLKKDNAYIAFSLWETPSIGDTAPSFASMTSSYEPGLSEYLYRCTAERVKDRYRYICVGGSETASLDRFKRKFGPAKTHTLRTLRLLVKDGRVKSSEAAEKNQVIKLPEKNPQTIMT
jgi:hypothetical protein